MTSSESVEYHPTIKEMPTGERPRERLANYGAGSMADYELLAILLRTGMQGENVLNLAQRLLTKHRGLGGLARSSFSELCRERGLGEAKAAQVKAALELGKRLLIAAPDERPQVKSPADVANLLLLEMGYLEQEHLRTALLDSKNHVISIPTIYQGSLNSTSLRVGEVFREAVRANSAALIVVHNHPSGDPTPSSDDAKITRLMVEAGHLLDIEVLDHLVIGHQRYVSLKEQKMGFS